MVGIPDTLATNSALGGTLKRLPEDFLLGVTHTDKVCGVRREKKSAADGEMTRRVTELKLLHSGNMSVSFNNAAVRTADRRTSAAAFTVSFKARNIHHCVKVHKTSVQFLMTWSHVAVLNSSLIMI